MKLRSSSQFRAWKSARHAGALLVACTLTVLGNQQPTAVAQDLTTAIQFEPAHLADENGDRPTDPAALLYDIRSDPGALPITAPDGHHITLGEWQAVRGEAHISRIPGGTELTLDVSGLVPNGVYTAWSAFFTESPFIVPNAVGFGAAGKNDGSEGTLIADENGTATYTVEVPPGPLSVRGEAPDYVLDGHAAYLVSGAYHIDSQTHGAVPGPNSVGAFSATFIPEPSSVTLALIGAVGLVGLTSVRRPATT